MKRLIVFCLLSGAGALALTTGIVAVQAAPESLLPPGFDDPSPTPKPRPTSTPRPAPSVAPTGTTGSSTGSGSSSSSSSTVGGTPIVQPIPSDSGRAPAPSTALPSNLPSLEELEKLEPDALDELLGLKPKFDMPPAARRSMERVGLLAEQEGGLPVASLGKQPGVLVRAALSGLTRPVVSRWGHILLRRALASRLETPQGLRPVEFAGLRAKALNALGEHHVARALVQDIDVGNWNRTVADAAVDAYVATGDIAGACPAVKFRGNLRDDAEWQMLTAICQSFTGESARARSNLIRMRQRDAAPTIDVLLAQRYAGAAGRGRSAVNLEWDGVDRLTPWRYGLATALGAELPEALTEKLDPYYERVAARTAALPVAERLRGADRAVREGILSADSAIDLYSQFYAENGTEGVFGPVAVQLREAYVAAQPSARLAAIEAIWGGENPDYARLTLTAYAAARLPALEEFSDSAGSLIAAMLAAGLDRDALEWGQVVAEGSQGWALLTLAQPNRSSVVSEDAVNSFVDNDGSDGQRKSAFLVAGLAGLGRLEVDAASRFSDDLGLGLARRSKWSALIGRAGELRNRALVAYLAGVGMQGSSWDRMTPRHLYHIVRALNRAGLSAEARMIAAEAVARG